MQKIVIWENIKQLLFVVPMPKTIKRKGVPVGMRSKLVKFVVEGFQWETYNGKLFLRYSKRRQGKLKQF